jgi:hypothetical protein
MGELEELKKTILAGYRNKFVFFETDGEPLIDMQKKTVVWAGDDYKDFLEMAEKVESKIIYYSEAFASNEKYEKRSDEVAEMDLGFYHNDFLHIMSICATWYNPEDDMVKGEEEESELNERGQRVDKKAHALLNEPTDAMVNKMKVFIDGEYKEMGSKPNTNNLSELQRQFWQQNGIDPWNLETKERFVTEKVERLVTKYYLDQIYKEEDQKIDSIIKECVEWCKGQGITGARYVKKSVLSAFLQEKDIELTKRGLDKLYTRVVMELKN